MSPTDLIFAFISLLLGLGIAEVLGGFARSIAVRRKENSEVRLGTLTPLVAIFIVVDLTSFWLLAYDFRDQFRATFPMLVGVLAICGFYYIVAYLVFPGEPDEWRSLDDYYDRQRRMLIGGILGANFTQLLGQILVEILVPAPDTAEAAMSDAAMALEVPSALVIVSCLVTLLFVRSRKWNRVLLIVLNLALLGVSTVTAGL
jgi:hypothetical protein